ncbi:MAG: sugar phosphate isomerase/epimerase family protein [Victivallales bacterium]
MFDYSVILANVGSCCDRYMPSGYSKGYTTEELFKRLSTIKGVSGVELISGADLAAGNSGEIKRLLKKHGLKASSIIPNHFGKEIWGRGAFTSADKGIRKAAVDETISMVDAAKQLGCSLLNIWNGQDGYDYPMQSDYRQTRKWLIEGIGECASRAGKIKLSLEYKPKEPRNHSFISNVHSTLLLIEDIGADNVGLTIDTGHSLMAYENMAESAVVALERGKLFHTHFNDNYRLWDDDMITGSVHTIEYIELLYWLKASGYSGWMSVDQYPYREDSVKAVEQSIKWLMTFEKVAGRIDKSELRKILNAQDAVKSTEFLRELIFK